MASLCPALVDIDRGRADGRGVGLVFRVLALLLSLRLRPPGQGQLPLPGLPGFVGFFLVQSVRGGFPVAAMALRP